MKRFLFSIVILALGTFSVLGMVYTDSEEEIDRIITDGNFLTGAYERSMYSYEIESYLLPMIGEVEVNLCNLGTSEIYIIDSTGQTIDYSCVNTDMPTTVRLSTNGPGRYSLVVISDIYYAEGYFTL